MMCSSDAVPGQDGLNARKAEESVPNSQRVDAAVEMVHDVHIPMGDDIVPSQNTANGLLPGDDSTLNSERARDGAQIEPVVKMSVADVIPQCAGNEAIMKAESSLPHSEPVHPGVAVMPEMAPLSHLSQNSDQACVQMDVESARVATPTANGTACTVQGHSGNMVPVISLQNVENEVFNANTTEDSHFAQNFQCNEGVNTGAVKVESISVDVIVSDDLLKDHVDEESVPKSHQIDAAVDVMRDVPIPTGDIVMPAQNAASGLKTEVESILNSKCVRDGAERIYEPKMAVSDEGPQCAVNESTMKAELSLPHSGTVHAGVTVMPELTPLSHGSQNSDQSCGKVDVESANAATLTANETVCAAQVCSGNEISVLSVETVEVEAFNDNTLSVDLIGPGDLSTDGVDNEACQEIQETPGLCERTPVRITGGCEASFQQAFEQACAAPVDIQLEGEVETIPDPDYNSSELSSDEDLNEDDVTGGEITKDLLDAFVFEEDTTSAPMRTHHEIDPGTIPLRDPSTMEISQNSQFTLAGSIMSIVEQTLVIQGSSSSAFDLDSAFCLEDRTPIGWVEDVFGRVDAPIYVVRLTAKQIANPGQFLPGAPVLCVQNISRVILPEHLDSKGTDQSNVFDEPCDEIPEFSDDEAEKAHKRQMKARKKANKSRHPQFPHAVNRRRP